MFQQGQQKSMKLSNEKSKNSFSFTFARVFPHNTLKYS